MKETKKKRNRPQMTIHIAYRRPALSFPRCFVPPAPPLLPLPCPPPHRFVVSSPRPFPLSSSPCHPHFIVVPPTVHPPSSCSWGWGRVVRSSSPLSVVGPWC